MQLLRLALWEPEVLPLQAHLAPMVLHPRARGRGVAKVSCPKNAFMIFRLD